MVSAIFLGIGAFLLWTIGKTINGYRKNIKKAKASGFTYIILPWHPMNPFWVLFQYRLLPLLEKLLPARWKGTWLSLMDDSWQWRYLRKPFEELNTEAILTVDSDHNVLFINDAAAIHQITASREKFPKPIFYYEILNAFGRNIISTEGHEWKRHRKAMAPAFNEKNNRLFFEESVMQAQGMVRHWMRGGTAKSSRTLTTVPHDTMSITLHIISAIGFGVRLVWPEETASDSDGSGLITFTNEPEHGHTMSFQESIKVVLEECLIIMLIPLKVLQYGTKHMRRTYEAYINWKAYSEEILTRKIESVRAREKVEGMDLMRRLVENTSDPSILTDTSPGKPESATAKRGIDLTKQEILGDTFITLLAGHETTASTIHFMLVHLAMAPSSQRHLQADVDATFGATPPDKWDYDTCITTLLGNMVGATFNEMLRVMPTVEDIPKAPPEGQDQTLTMDGDIKIVYAGSRIIINNIGSQRCPKYWPSTGPSKITNSPHDIDDFVPERWLQSDASRSQGGEEKQDVDKEFGGFTGTDTSSLLFRPVPGSYNPFSSGSRSCLGRRMAQIEMVTVMSVIFQNYSVELAVDEWATDEQVERMTGEEKRKLYEKATEKARKTLRTASNLLTLKLRGAHGGEKFIPLRIVKRGEERFIGLFN